MSETLLMLRSPSANRVYTRSAGPLTAAEARWVLTAHLGRGVEVCEHTIGGMDALEIRTPGTRGEGEDRQHLLTLLATLSACYGVLEIVDPAAPVAPAPRAGVPGATSPIGTGDRAAGGAPLLRALEMPAPLHHPDELETIQKYPGKTNEQFTALLVNLASALSTRRDHLFDGTLSLLDPMCGRGTTLNRALRLGLSPIGAEIDHRDVEAYRTFLSTWLRSHRYKHTVSESALTVHGTRHGRRLHAELAVDKRAQREGRSQSVTVHGCDTRRLGRVLRRGSIDALVADLPYGVQHGSRADAGWQRSPLELLRSVAPTWRRLLRDGGGAALAINRHTLDHDAASEALRAAGLRVISADGAFRHRVDQSIDRDILLAVPTDHPRAGELAALGADQERTLS